MAESLRRLASVLVGVVLAASCAIAPARAQYAAGGALGELDRTAASARQGTLVPHLDRNQRLRATVERRDRERLIATLSAVAIARIAEEPRRREQILAAAQAAAPEVADEVRARILAAYPGRAGASAGGGSGSAASISRPVAGPAGLPPRPGDDAASARLQAWLIGAIAEDPAGLERYVGQAVAEMPQARARLVESASRAFPGHAARIAAAASGAAPRSPPASVRAAAAEPAPATPAVSGPEETWDPLETVNRFTDSINQAIDFILLEPLATIYTTITPDPVILAVRRFFANLRQPVVLANDLLQLSFRDAATAAGRFGVNTTIGLLGFFDPATGMGLAAHHADFGQTLYSYGAGPGPYLVLPLLGPSTLRDGIGQAVDLFFQPTTYLLTQGQSLALAGAKGLAAREELLQPLAELKASSLDYYSALRSAYYQRRAIELNKGLATSAAGQSKADELFEQAR